IQSVHITHVEDTANTLRTHQKAFIARGLTEALTRVIAIVVQPGVEFDHSNIIHYQPQEAQPLAQWIENTRMVYEAHSTDYQTRTAYWELVRDHFAILKVGPALT
ncbi:class II D-tagatose-bisphosphate aldolase non-catalytic subunit, partial [Escherichia coli]